MSCNGGKFDVALADNDKHSEPLHGTGTLGLSANIEDDGTLNGESLEDDDDDEDEEDEKFLQELRERREMAFQVVVEVYTEVHDTT